MPTALTPDDHALLDRFYAGLCTAEEQARAERIITRTPIEEEFVRGLQVALSTSTVEPGDAQRTAAVHALLAKIDAHGQERVRAGSQVLNRRSVQEGVFSRQTLLIGIAVVLTVAIGISRVRSGAPSAPNVSEPARTVSTGIGQHRTFTLRDGTRITLAPQTTLTIRGSELSLVGEVCLAVQQHSAKPLTVRTGKVTTRVLGTVFDVRRYPADSTTRVAVAEGKVATGGTTSVVVTAGHVAQITDSTATSITSDDASAYTNWTDGLLVFHNVPTREVLETLGHWYGLQFQLKDSALAVTPVDLRFTNQSVRDVLTVLRDVLNVTMTVDGNVVTLLNKSPRRAPPARGNLPGSFPTSLREAGR